MFENARSVSFVASVAGYASTFGPARLPGWVLWSDGRREDLWGSWVTRLVRRLAVAAVCIPFWIAARLQLGESFSVRPEARHLVTTGIYSKIRHPVYVFGTPAVTGILVALLGWKAVIIAGIGVAGSRRAVCD